MKQLGDFPHNLADSHKQKTFRKTGLRNTVLLTVALFAAVVCPAFSHASSSDQQILQNLELRSIFVFGGTSEFSLHDGTRDITFWIGLGETRHGITVREFDRANNRVLVQYGERSAHVALKDTEVRPMEEVADVSQPDQSSGASGGGAPQRSHRNPEERLDAALQAWEAGTSEDRQLRELDNHFRAYFDEFQSVREQMWQTTDHESQTFQDLRERRRELREEVGILNDLLGEVIQDNPRFENIERNQLLGALRYQHLRREESDE